jgi:hypothetical protein
MDVMVRTRSEAMRCDGTTTRRDTRHAPIEHDEFHCPLCAAPEAWEARKRWSGLRYEVE